MTPVFNFATFPVLRTPRLVLREMQPSDAKALLRIRGDVRVTRLKSGQPMQTLDEARELIEKAQQAFTDHRRIDWGITLRDDPQAGIIGRCQPLAPNPRLVTLDGAATPESVDFPVRCVDAVPDTLVGTVDASGWPTPTVTVRGEDGRTLTAGGPLAAELAAWPDMEQARTRPLGQAIGLPAPWQGEAWEVAHDGLGGVERYRVIVAGRGHGDAIWLVIAQMPDALAADVMPTLVEVLRSAAPAASLGSGAGG